MKKILSLLLALVLVLSLAACGGEKPEPTTEPTEAPTSAPTTEPTQAPTTEPTEAPTTEPVVTDNALVSFSMGTMENFEPVTSMYIADNGDGTVFVQYMGEFRKQSFAFDAAALTEIANALATLDLTTLGESVYGEGNKSCSLYVSYADGSVVMYDYSGEEIPAEFTAMMNTMDAAFQAAIADLEIYVPQVQVMGDLDAGIQTEILEIMNNSGIANLDSLYVQPIALDENFGFAAGLTNADGITAAAVCQGMMSTPYSLVVVTLEDEANAANVAADFEANLDLAKWVCVRADTAMIAQKGNMVLCLMGADTMYTGTAAAIENAGWTVIKTITE